jgi:WD40 repeat protein
MVTHQDGTVRVWDLRANECSQTMTPSDGTHEGAAGHGTLGESAVAIRSVSMSSDASLVVAGNNAGRVFCWRPHSSSGGGGGGGDDAAANTSAAAGGSAFTPIASGGAGGGGGSGYGYRPLGVTNTMHDGYLLKCVISPDVNRLVTCSADKTVKIWNINTQRLNAFLEDEDDDDDDDEDDDEEDDAADKNAAEGEDEDEDGGGGEGGRNGEGEDGEQSNGASAASSSSSSSSSAEDSSASSSSSSSSSSTSPSNAPPPVPSKAGLRTPPPPANAASSSSSSSSSGSGGGSGGSGGSGGVVAFPRAPHSSGLGFGPGSMVGGLTLERNLAQHQRWVWDACFSADSAYLVTASSDQTAKLWDVQTGEVIRHYTSQMAITCVALNDASS